MTLGSNGKSGGKVCKALHSPDFQDQKQLALRLSKIRHLRTRRLWRGNCFYEKCEAVKAFGGVLSGLNGKHVWARIEGPK